MSEVKARLEYDKSAVNSIVTLLVGMACQVYPLKARPGRQKDNNTSLYVYVWYESQTGINLKSGKIGSFFLLVCQQEGTIQTHLAEPGRQRDNNTSLCSLNLQQRGQIVVARNILGVADEKARLENDLTTATAQREMI